jgi:hypothetical protein
MITVKLCRVISGPSSLFVPFEDPIATYDLVCRLSNGAIGVIVAGWRRDGNKVQWEYWHNYGGMEDFSEFNAEDPRLFKSFRAALKRREIQNNQPTFIQYSVYIWIDPGSFEEEVPFTVRVVGEAHPLTV